MSRAPAVLVLGALLCLLAGCTSGPPPVGEPRVDVVTFAPTICDQPYGVSGKVHAFVDAYDRGEAGLADRFFAPAPRFRWYSEHGLREGAAAYDRSTLDAYLMQREHSGDHLDLVGVTRSGGGGDFSFTARRADEMLPSKGALDCRTGLFTVWSLGPNPGP